VASVSGRAPCDTVEASPASWQISAMTLGKRAASAQGCLPVPLGAVAALSARTVDLLTVAPRLVPRCDTG